MEVSFHLTQPAVYTTLTSGVTAGSGVTAAVSTTAAMYPGALLVVEKPQNSAIEGITVISVVDGTHFTANFASNHSSGAPVWGATFPVQYQTDPIYTQPEMLGYLSRAQNEFLAAVPCSYQRFFQAVPQNTILQATPSTAVQIDRIAASAINIPIATLVRSGNVVTLTASGPTGLTPGSTFLVYAGTGSGSLGDSSFAGAFAVATAPSANVLTYPQAGSNGSTTGGWIQQMSRLYEVTQEEIALQNRNWRNTQTGPLTNWFEDRTGLYKWGVGGLPSSTFPAELLCAVRDTDSLSLLDGFLIPDVIAHGMKYLVLAYARSKDGVAFDARMADFFQKRYAQVVMATQRYIQAMKMGVK